MTKEQPHSICQDKLGEFQSTLNPTGSQISLTATDTDNLTASEKFCIFPMELPDMLGLRSASASYHMGIRELRSEAVQVERNVWEENGRGCHSPLLCDRPPR
jgi:hypothetical protein